MIRLHIHRVSLHKSYARGLTDHKERDCVETIHGKFEMQLSVVAIKIHADILMNENLQFN